MSNTTWTPRAHSPIEKLETNLWRVQGPLPSMPLERVMTLVRLDDGRLVIHNAIALNEPAMREIEQWGKPAYLIVPNGYHRLDAPAYKTRYPELQVFCPQGGLKKVQEKVPVNGTYEDFPIYEAVQFQTLDGVANNEGVMLVQSDGNMTLVFNDLIFNMPHRSGFHGFVLKYISRSSGGPKITPISRWFIIKDRQAVRRHLEALANIPNLKRILVSHHVPIEQNPAETLRRVAETLK